MQQSQQILLSVKHKLPQPNSLLPFELVKSQPAKHIHKRVHDIQAISSFDWPLDLGSLSSKQRITQLLNNYYGDEFQLADLLKWQSKIVFLNPLVDTSHLKKTDYYFGTIKAQSTSSNHIKPKIRQNKYQKQPIKNTILQFDDKIQSGNLYLALQHDPHTYILANRFDFNTKSYGQWFYFKVTNITEKSGDFQFCIVNMTKNGTMFGKGLKISVCRDGVWGKQGSNITYAQNKFIRGTKLNHSIESQTYFTLVFNIHINSHESLYIAYNQPYTYTKMGTKIDKLMQRNPLIYRSLLCRTPLGNRIDMLTISKKANLKNKKVIFITARAHPVQTAGSYVVQGIIQQLMKSNVSPDIQYLLENYVVKIIPMLNPDGVIVGNSRCNLYGYDLNRQWKHPSRETAPEIVNIKKAILKYAGRIEMVLDLHGHSKKKNVFAYGCHDIKNPIASREFPYLLSKFSQKNFLFNQCKFSLLTESKNNGKDGTARVSLWSELKIPNIFTIQSSYCCAQGSQFHYDSKSYGQIGKDIVTALCQYFRNQQPEQDQTSDQNFTQQKKNRKNTKNILKQLRKNKKLIMMNINNQSSASSDSEIQFRLESQQNKSILQSPIKKIFRNKNNNNNNNNNNNYIKQRTQTSLKKHNNVPSKYKEIKRHATIQAHSEKQQEFIHSSSNADLKTKIKLRNLSPITKKYLPLTRGDGTDTSKQKNQKQTSINNSKNQLKQKTISPEKSKFNTMLSIVQIGLQNSLIDSSRGDNEILKTFSAKSIKNDYQSLSKIYTLNPSKSNKLNRILKNLAPPQLEPHSDHRQFRQPTLKVKKNIAKNSSRIQDLMVKLKSMQFNMSMKN